MTSVRAWLALLIERALNEYLADEYESVHSSPSSGLFLYEQTLSNLRVTPDPSLLDTVHLVDTRDQRKEVKAVIGDLKHTVRATFSKTALEGEAISTSGVPFEKLQVGALFKIVACEIRFSDCFDPARVDFRITSVAVIHPGIGSGQFAKSLNKVEDEPSVLLKLKEYNFWRGDPMDSDGEKDELVASQEFMTQLPYQSLNAPSPVRPSPDRPVSISKPLETTRNQRAIQVGTLARNVSNKGGREVPPQKCQKSPVPEAFPSSARFITQMPMHVEERSITIESNTANTLKAKTPEPTHQQSTRIDGESSTADNSRTEKGDCEGMSMRLSTGGRSVWQRRTARAQYLPRYVGIRARDQQELIENNASWQPSLVGQRIEGQVPLHLLEKLSQAADAAAEERDQGIDDEDSSDEKEADLADRGPRTTIAVESRPVGSAPQESPSISSSQTSWEDTPPRPVQVRPLLPPDSSPLKGTEEAGANEFGIRRQSNVDESSGPSAHAEQKILSSPIYTAASSDDEEHDTNPARHQAAIPVATEATFLDIGSDSDDQPDDITPADDLPDAGASRTEEPTFVVDGHPQKSSNDTAAHGAILSLDAVQSVRVSRTPAIQKRKSDSTAVNCRMDRTLDPSHSSLLQASQTQSHPPSSPFVPATYLAQPPQKGSSVAKSLASTVMPTSDLRSSGMVCKEESDGPQSEGVRTKRKPESLVCELSSKRQKIEGLRGKPIPTAKDPDLWPSEIRARQDRTQFMAEEKQKQLRREQAREVAARAKEVRKKENRDMQERARWEEEGQEEKQKGKSQQEKERQEKLARNQQSHAGTLVEDNRSVESRDRPASTPSSLLSISKHNVSTPNTRSSVHQASNFGRDQLDGRPLKLASIVQAAAQDTFELFRSTYPDYKGGRTQFEQACQLLHDLGRSAPRAYLNDDFVFRYNNDYMGDYLLRVTKGRQLPMPFECFYQKLEQNSNFEPLSVAKVLKPARLSRMLKEASLREGTANIHGQTRNGPQFSWPVSLSTTTNVKPRVVVHLPARSDENAVLETGSLKPNNMASLEVEPKSRYQSINRSQDSSITDWLRKSGEQSPELGTPPDMSKLADVPDLDLEILAAPAPKSTFRPLPWTIPEKPSPAFTVTARAPTQTTTLSTSASAQKPRINKGKGKAVAVAVASRRHTDFPFPTSRTRNEEPPIDFSTPFVKPRSNGEMAMEKMAAQCLKQDERRGVPKVSCQSPVDIFSWSGEGK